MAFKEWDLNLNARSNAMTENEFAITFREGTDTKAANYSITLNANLSELARSKGFNTLSVSQDDITGELAFVLRKNGNGIPMHLNGNKAGTQTRGNLTASHKPTIKRLFEVLNLKEGNRYILTLSANKSVRDDVMFFLINQN